MFPFLLMKYITDSFISKWHPTTALVIPLSINRYITISRQNMGQIWPPVYYPCAHTRATMKE